MTELAKTIGQRIRIYRTRQHLSQEKLAELADCHPTYIGQIERGEKNATIESIWKISYALEVSLSKLFENIGENGNISDDIPLKCYDLIAAKKKSEQKELYNILIEIDRYKNI